MPIIEKEIKDLNFSDDVLLDFLKLDEKDYQINKTHTVLIDRYNNVISNLLGVVIALDLNKTYVTCEYAKDTTITYDDTRSVPTIPYKWDNRKADYINICLELEQVEKHFNFAAWKLYCVLNGINQSNYDKYKLVLARYNKTPNDLPNKNMPIGRVYEIAKLPKPLIEHTYNVEGKQKKIYEMNIKQIKNLKLYI